MTFEGLGEMKEGGFADTCRPVSEDPKQCEWKFT